MGGVGLRTWGRKAKRNKKRCVRKGKIEEKERGIEKESMGQVKTEGSKWKGQEREEKLEGARE